MTPEEQEELRVLRAQIAVLEVAAERHDVQIPALVVAILSTMGYVNSLVDHLRAEGTPREPETFAAVKKNAAEVMNLLDTYGKSASDTAEALHKIADDLQSEQAPKDG